MTLEDKLLTNELVKFLAHSLTNRIREITKSEYLKITIERDSNGFTEPTINIDIIHLRDEYGFPIQINTTH